MREDKTKQLLGRSGGRGDVPVAENMYMTVFEKSRRGAKDKINVASDVTVFKMLAAPIQKDCVLPTKKAAVAKRDTVAIDTDRQRLAHRPGGILKSDVLDGEIVCVDERR